LLQNYVWQLAAEQKYQRDLVAKIKSAPAPSPSLRPDVQAIFCIDVRSEVFRRALESTSEKIETVGFAGFFGFAIERVPFGSEYGSPQCPVLLTPGFRIEEKPVGATPSQIESELQTRVSSTQLGRAWNAFKTSAVSCFSFVETGGLLSGAKLVKDTLHVPHREYSHDEMKPYLHKEESSGMSLGEQIDVAASALKNMGLTKNLARIVMICGHGSHTTNNPYGAGLDCGACGGNSGAANARVAAMVLNNEKVRAGLLEKGIAIPEDTRFLAALHNTTTDEITLFDTEEIPQSHRTDLSTLRHHLKIASQKTRQMRAPSLGLSDLKPAVVDLAVETRSHDWAQTRPEWGLAGNAAFIAAPRSRTKNVDLNGRAFLNNYDYASDTDGSILELVMCAPMVVASWINLQYFASTTNNDLFGSGNKTIHNVVGAMGIWEGNHGDLQVGLPLQSVHDGSKWIHEPLRLSVFIEAPREAITEVIARHESVRELVDNGWLHLFAIEENGRSFARYQGGLRWQEEK
jgi:uncharacterized protein YbcC (UPF0753/DUF2309 family)